MRRSRAGQAGFTLVELLVALAVTMLIAAALAGTFQFARRAWQTTADIEQTASVAAVQGFLAATLAAAQPGARAVGNRPGEVTFDGRSDRLAFVAPSSVRVTLGGFYRFEIFAADDEGENGRRSLMVVQSLYRPWPARQNVTKVYRRKLLGDVAGLTVRYFGTKDGDNGPAWYDTWTNSAALPRLVEVSVEFAKGDVRTWPPLTVQMRLAGPS